MAYPTGPQFPYSGRSHRRLYPARCTAATRFLWRNPPWQGRSAINRSNLSFANRLHLARIQRQMQRLGLGRTCP